MDTSEQYIKMWLASGLEIEPDGFQPWVCPHCNLILTPTMANAYSVDPGMKNRHFCPDFMDRGYASTKVTPLARQDQLQEMAHVCECSDPVCLLIDFHKFVDRESNPDIEHSWEQLWLAFVMHELHNKKWAGKKWEIVKEG